MRILLKQIREYEDFIFEKKRNSEPTVGDIVYNSDWIKVKNGKIRYSFFKQFLIENGKITQL